MVIFASVYSLRVSNKKMLQKTLQVSNKSIAIHTVKRDLDRAFLREFVLVLRQEFLINPNGYFEYRTL